MTKKFDVILVEDYGVVVDKEDNPIKGEVWINQTFFNEIGTVYDVYGNEFEIQVQEDRCGWSTREDVHQIIATIGKRIEGLPLIELSDDRWDLHRQVDFSEFWLGFKDGEHPCSTSKALRIYQRGYEAAQSKGVYSEEDMRKAHWHGWFTRERYNGPDKHGYEDKLPANWKDMDYEEREDWFADQLIQSLQKNKLPVALELEIEGHPLPAWQPNKNWELTGETSLGMSSNHIAYKIKITDPENNTIKPVNVFYK